MKTYTKGTMVYVSTPDGRKVMEIIGYGDANDGTGRYGWWCRDRQTGNIWWRQRVIRVSGADTRA